MTRFIRSIASLFMVAGLVWASGARGEIFTEQLLFRTTVPNAATSALPWTLPTGHAYFADSSVFRHRSAAANDEDTTQAYPISRFIRRWPAPTTVVAGMDSLAKGWLMLTCAADEDAYGFAGTSVLDSFYIGAQVSIDGSSWANVDGAPTRPYFAATVSPINGTPCLWAIEQAPGANFATVTLGCAPMTQSPTDRLVINLNLCTNPGWIRFIVSTGAGTGQFKLLATFDDGT